MVRLFERHLIRKSREIAGTWDFCKLNASDNIDEIGDFPFRLPVPGCWEMHPELSTYRGKGCYRRRFSTRGGAVRLEFKGVSHTAHIYVDHQLTTTHYNAYTPFQALVEHLEPGNHEMLVVADNFFSPDSALHVPNDYFTYGGLIRPVVLEELPSVFIDYVHFIPALRGSDWSATLTIGLRNIGSVEAAVTATVQVAGVVIEVSAVTVPPYATALIEREASFPSAEAWTHESPQLYDLVVEVSSDGVISDDLIDRVGFRTVQVEGNRILLNGEEISIKGFNRHEDHGEFGCSLPMQAMVHDLDLVAEMGANAIRTSHYPNDELFLDMCDERGFLVWEENHARGLNLRQMKNPRFGEQCERVNLEMVRNHINHPSIIMWGILNECASNTPEGSAMYRRQLDQIRGMDPSRPLTFASCWPEDELTLDAVDVVSYNIYSGWYNNNDSGEFVDQLKRWIDAHGGAGKPLIISEFGADGIYGIRDPRRPRGSEERQCDVLAKNLSDYLSRDYINGLFIWQFCDCRVTDEPTDEGRILALSRPGGFNRKGVVDSFRRPKLAFDTVRRFYAGE